ncbi:SEC-C metal-binding domain-containing protein [Occallatibacter riparius]|uniref:SEC-C domain-containing protein n=1 Tax=Occallatibacter riparius TaxID=1002689 RepID=A0A9J7BSR5_9BACT|nr:SEC-C metal-binding domain-containing protein [Occallatibacter riparius]UWZ84794.1 SEC-C domain-containing protein [Occallatibacter riparius]
MSAEDTAHLFSREHLIRTERSTLIGLMVQQAIDWSLPDAKTLQRYIDETERLLEEFHESMSGPTVEELRRAVETGSGANPFQRGENLREPIFYSGESAYSFQFRDLSVPKYQADNPWLEKQRGFTIQSARDVVHALVKLQNGKFTSTFASLADLSPEEWTFLPSFVFTVDELAEASDMDRGLIERVVNTFILPADQRNACFRAVDDFNVVCAAPIIPIRDGQLLLLEQYTLEQSLYESPFFWMWDDKAYRNTLHVNRCKFLEDLSEARLKAIFGERAVLSNIRVSEGKGKDAGEIDTLVLFGDRAIIVQAKSKRLTMEARKGNDNLIRSDFKKSVQDSYDQALGCARALTSSSYAFLRPDETRIEVPKNLKEIYILCLVSDHYPALSFQVRQFLKYEADLVIQAPFVLDVFTLDVIAEMLETPIQFLSYLKRRASYQEKIYTGHELTILSYHLKRNLWFEEQYDMIQLGDDIAADLDIAMMVRREGAPGPRTPDGILTRVKGTRVGEILRQIESRPNPGTINLGFALLMLSEDAVVNLSDAIDKMAWQSANDGSHHDLTMPMGESGEGLTVHCNSHPIPVAVPKLEKHCLMRKYRARAARWYGICIAPDASIRFGVNLEFTWEPDPTMDRVISAYPGHGSFTSMSAPHGKRGKIGRNDPCPCGSGRKFKKCCSL